MINPFGNQGYFVLNYLKYPDVKTWNIAVKKTTTTDTSVTHEYMLRKGFGGVNYGRLPLNYLSNQMNEGVVYSLEAEGFNALSEPIITSTISNLCTGCQPGNLIGILGKCIGPSWAWQASIYQVNNQFYISIDPTYDYYNEASHVYVPHYQYMYVNELNTLLGTTGQGLLSLYSNNQWFYKQIRDYYKFEEFFTIEDLVINGKVKILYDIQNGIFDQYGQLLLSDIAEIRGINKTPGFWQNTITLGPFDSSTITSITGAWELTFLVNNNSDWIAANLPDLVCPAEDFLHENEDPFQDDPIDCMQTFLDDSFNGDEFDNQEYIGFWTNLVSCIGDINENIGSITDGNLVSNFWPNNLKSLSISSIDSIGRLNFSLKKSDLNDSALINFFRLNFTKGLYLFNFQLDNNKILPLFYEFKRNVSSILNQSNLLSVVVYPVPTVKNHFNLKLSSPIGLSFQYKLFDFNGNILYRSSFDLESGVESDFSIIPHVIIPNGIITHVFTFQDGSTKSINTIKIEN